MLIYELRFIIIWFSPDAIFTSLELIHTTSFARTLTIAQRPFPFHLDKIYAHLQGVKKKHGRHTVNNRKLLQKIISYVYPILDFNFIYGDLAQTGECLLRK